MKGYTKFNLDCVDPAIDPDLEQKIRYFSSRSSSLSLSLELQTYKNIGGFTPGISTRNAVPVLLVSVFLGIKNALIGYKVVKIVCTSLQESKGRDRLARDTTTLNDLKSMTQALFPSLTIHVDSNERKYDVLFTTLTDLNESLPFLEKGGISYIMVPSTLKKGSIFRCDHKGSSEKIY